MATYTDRFETHPVHDILGNFGRLIEQVEELITADPSLIEDGSRLRTIHQSVVHRLDSTDPQLVPQQTLDRLRDFYNQITSELTSYVSNKNPAHLTNANSHADQLLLVLPQIPMSIEGADVELVRESVSSFRKSAGQYLRYVEEDVDSLRNEIQDLSARVQETINSIEAQKTRLDTAIAQFQQQFSEAEDSRRTRFTDEETRRSGEHSSSVEEMKLQFKSTTEVLDQQSSQVIKKANEDLDQARETLQNQASVQMAELDRMLEQAQELVFVIANTGMAGGYQKIANQERRASTFWKSVAVLSMIGLILFAVFAFQATLGTVFNLPKFAARTLVTSTFGILAAYAARQASKHDDKERYNRKMELEMASIDPFLAGLPEESKQQVKADLAQRLFAQKLPAISDDSEETTGSLLDLLKLAIEGLAKIR